MNNMLLTKKCGICGNVQKYNTVSSLNRSIKNNSICKNCIRKSDLSVLLNDNYITYYWIGFIMADGSISDSNRLRVAIHKKDIDHLIKLKNFLSIKNILSSGCNREMVGISAMNTRVIDILSKKFCIKNNKTYIPCSLENISVDLLFSLSIGFIDGDGSISKQYKREDPVLRVKNYKTWYSNLLLMYGNCKINGRGYAVSCICENKILKEMKRKALSLNLPIMERKWNNIDLNYTSGSEIFLGRLSKIEELLSKELSRRDICNELNISKSVLSYSIKKLKNNK